MQSFIAPMELFPGRLALAKKNRMKIAPPPSQATPKRFNFDEAMVLSEMETLRPEYALMGLIDERRKTEDERRLGKTKKSPFDDILNAKVARAMSGYYSNVEEINPALDNAFSPAAATARMKPKLAPAAAAVLEGFGFKLDPMNELMKAAGGKRVSAVYEQISPKYEEALAKLKATSRIY